MLIRAAAEGEIELKYLDEAGCCLESPVIQRQFGLSRTNLKKKKTKQVS